jgi:hypothetical protein
MKTGQLRRSGMFIEKETPQYLCKLIEMPALTVSFGQVGEGIGGNKK